MVSFDLAGRTALVTGANVGIGQAIAVALAEAGMDIVAASSSMSRTGSETARAVEARGRSFTGYDVDFSDHETVREFADRLVAEGPAVDTLVNNAGAIYREPALTHSQEQWQRILDIDLTSQFILTQVLGGAMVGRGFGRIISIASMRVFQGGEGVLGYTAAKAGLAGITRSFANEWGRHNVTANAIAPGYVTTENTRVLQEDQAAYQRILDRIPVARWASPEDIGGAVVFLASPAADYITGVTLPVDGGWLVR